MGKKTFPKWLNIHIDGTLTIAWKGYTEYHPFDSIEPALDQTIHILEEYGDEKITIDDKTIVILGKISELKKFRSLAKKTISFLKSSSLNFTVSSNIKNEIAMFQEEILTNIEGELKKDIAIFFAVMRRSLALKEEIMEEKLTILNIYNSLWLLHDSLSKHPTESNLRRVKNHIACGKVNLINGFSKILVNPFKERISLPTIQRLKNIENVNSVEEIKKIIKRAARRLKPIIAEEIRSEIFLNNQILSQGRG